MKSNRRKFFCRIVHGRAPEAEIYIWCKIISGKDILLVGCIYRPPNSPREISTQINKTIAHAKRLVIQKIYTSLLIFGDFNHPSIQWSNLGGHCSSRFAQGGEFFPCLEEKFLHQINLEPNFKKNILDLVITDDINRIFSINTGPSFSSSKKNFLHNCLEWVFFYL